MALGDQSGGLFDPRGMHADCELCGRCRWGNYLGPISSYQDLVQAKSKEQYNLGVVVCRRSDKNSKSIRIESRTIRYASKTSILQGLMGDM